MYYLVWLICPILSLPSQLFPQLHQVSSPNSDMVGLVTALLPLYILEVGGVGWTTLNPAFTPVTAVISVLTSTYTTVATIYATLNATVVNQSLAISPLHVVSMASVSTPIF